MWQLQWVITYRAVSHNLYYTLFHFVPAFLFDNWRNDPITIKNLNHGYFQKKCKEQLRYQKGEYEREMHLFKIRIMIKLYFQSQTTTSF